MSMKTGNNIQERIVVKEMCRLSGMTMGELASAIGVSGPTLTNSIARGMSPKRASEIASALKCGVGDLTAEFSGNLRREAAAMLRKRRGRRIPLSEAGIPRGVTSNGGAAVSESNGVLYIERTRARREWVKPKETHLVSLILALRGKGGRKSR